MRRFMVLAAVLAVLAAACALDSPEVTITGTLHGNPPVLLFEHIHHHRAIPKPWWDHIRIWAYVVLARW